MHLPLLGVALFVFWLLLSGYWSNPLLLFFGLLSTALVLLITSRITRTYRLDSPWSIYRRLPAYAGWLLLEVYKANISVLKHIWFPGRHPIAPAVRRFPIHSRTRLGQTIFANSITLTPGTVSFGVSDNEVTVHAIEEGAIEELMDGDMNDRVAALEQETP